MSIYLLCLLVGLVQNTVELIEQVNIPQAEVVNLEEGECLLDGTLIPLDETQRFVSYDPPVHKAVCCMGHGYCRIYLDICPNGTNEVQCPCPPPISTQWFSSK